VNLYAHVACVRVESQLKRLEEVRREHSARSRKARGPARRGEGRDWRRHADVCWVSLSAEQLPPDGGLTFEWRGGPAHPETGA
jgi:hypothetical protein